MENDSKEQQSPTPHPVVGTCSIHDLGFDADDPSTWEARSGQPTISIHDSFAKDGVA